MRKQGVHIFRFLFLSVCVMILIFAVSGIPKIEMFQKVPKRVITLKGSESSQADDEWLKGRSKMIAFIETTKGEKCFDYRQSCAVESTARHNPDVDVVVFLRADKVPANCSTFRQFIQPEIAEFKNVKIIQYDLAGLFKDTPLFQWGQDVEEDRIKSKYMSAHLSDALRLALAHKYHAAYMDLDFITLRPLSDLLDLVNFLVKENSNALSNGIFRFGRAHRFTAEAMREFAEHYDPSAWSYSGPRLFERLLKRWGCDLKEDVCQDIVLVPPFHVYPIHYSQWPALFNQNDASRGENIMMNEQVYTLHLWNYLTKAHASPVAQRNPINLCAKQNCPRTFKLAEHSRNASF